MTNPEKSLERKWNFLLMGLLVMVVLAAFFWQVQKTKQDFLDRATEHSRMIAGMVSFALNNAKQSQTALEKTILSFLASTAKFTDFLDSVEPFSSDELSSFASEASLAGIKLRRYNGSEVEGPAGWSPDLPCEPAPTSLKHYPERNLYLLIWPSDEPGCILVGYDSANTELLIRQIGVEQLIEDMARLPLIEYIRLKKNRSSPSPLDPAPPVTRLLKKDGRQIAESRIQFDSQTELIVGVDASRYTRRIQRLLEEFFLFSILLTGLGGFFSWLISRHQAMFVKQTRKYEREIARQHEEAALGRAAATISHEIKNPLNAISMGLQRLQIESGIPKEHNKLISSMRQAVKRTNHIISDLKQYSQDLSLQVEELDPDQLIEDVLTLYMEKCRSLRILVSHDRAGPSTIHGDRTLLGQLFENILKNAIEAQPAGGKIDFVSRKKRDHWVLTMKNPGLNLEAADVTKIGEPYFTSKTQGSGLGLDICRRIIEAHGGTMSFSVPAPGVLQTTARLPAGRPGMSIQETKKGRHDQIIPALE